MHNVWEHYRKRSYGMDDHHRQRTYRTPVDEDRMRLSMRKTWMRPPTDKTTWGRPFSPPPCGSVNDKPRTGNVATFRSGNSVLWTLPEVNEKPTPSSMCYGMIWPPSTEEASFAFESETKYALDNYQGRAYLTASGKMRIWHSTIT